MNLTDRIANNTVSFADTPVWILERTLLEILVSPKYINRDDLDASRGVSGDDLARLRVGECQIVKPIGEQSGLWSDVRRHTEAAA